jgi:predicted nucleic acid-binding protein
MSIIYLDTSALLKLYIQEAYSDDVGALVTAAAGAGTSILTYTEIAAAMARAERMCIISGESAKSAWGNFLKDWSGFFRLKISGRLTERAADLAWDFGLRGYDAMHLAAALTWQDALGELICLATFDRILWSASKNAGLSTWPDILPDN